jgi:hypothetical protein
VRGACPQGTGLSGRMRLAAPLLWGLGRVDLEQGSFGGDILEMNGARSRAGLGDPTAVHTPRTVRRRVLSCRVARGLTRTQAAALVPDRMPGQLIVQWRDGLASSRRVCSRHASRS